MAGAVYHARGGVQAGARAQLEICQWLRDLQTMKCDFDHDFLVTTGMRVPVEVLQFPMLGHAAIASAPSGGLHYPKGGRRRKRLVDVEADVAQRFPLLRVSPPNTARGVYIRRPA